MFADPLAQYTTLRQIAPRVGSYFTAYGLATAGAFGDPVAIVGRTRLYARAAVDAAVSAYLAKRAARAGKAA